MVWTSAWAGCNAGCYPLDKITILQRRSIWETNCTIQWIEIYPASDNAIHLLNNWGQTLNLTSLYPMMNPTTIDNNNNFITCNSNDSRMVEKPFVIGFLLAFLDLTVHNVE